MDAFTTKKQLSVTVDAAHPSKSPLVHYSPKMIWCMV
jgi:hypothetical protein